MTFSARLPAVLARNALTVAVDRRRRAGESWIDLTESNPTAVGIAYPAGMLDPLSDSRAMRYEPQALGLLEARESVAAEYARRGVHVSPDRIALTSSTSEAYAVLFKLLCDPGDHVLVPQPSYPLFDLLTRLDGVNAQPYNLEYRGAWWLDRDSVEAAAGPDTRAILVVSPNNPTGSMLRASDRDWLWQFCAQRNLALIADEVFADYPLAPPSDASAVLAGDSPVLVFALGGLSKSAGLPQAKLAWIALGGPEPLVAAALERLELICDTYLSVSTPVQIAAPALLTAGAIVRRHIADRVTANLRRLRDAVAPYPGTSLLEPEAGWSAVLRVPAIGTEEALVLRLLEEAGVLVHPGYFFDFPHEAFLVLSLIVEPSLFATALDRVLPLAAGAR